MYTKEQIETAVEELKTIINQEGIDPDRERFLIDDIWTDLQRILAGEIKAQEVVAQ